MKFGYIKSFMVNIIIYTQEGIKTIFYELLLDFERYLLFVEVNESHLIKFCRNTG